MHEQRCCEHGGDLSTMFDLCREESTTQRERLDVKEGRTSRSASLQLSLTEDDFI